MASGDPVVQVIRVVPPAANAATVDWRAGGSTPAENFEVYDFDDGTDEFIDFLCKLEGYGGSGLTCTLTWSATTATTGNVVWGLAVRRIQDDAEDVDTSHTYVYNTVTDAAPSASGEVVYPTIAFTDGADMDSWAEGELAIVRVTRDADNGSDTLSGDAEFWFLFGLET